MLTNRDFHGEEFWKRARTDAQLLETARNNRPPGKPDPYEAILMKLDKLFIDFYRRIL